jgi:Protein of unknown function (DUF1592)/Protein of unknown function (DUF1588)/Protein of unknown function (DUF1587)/Protein of unknown function (DUF1595)/Protein of unknown function (DUF1585)
VGRSIGESIGIIALGLLPLAAGCYRGEGPGAADGDDNGSGSSGGSDESGGEPGECEPVPARVGLQRLTRDEYNRTVRDLFGVTSNPADAFPPDSATGGFDNNAKSLTISPQLASLLLDAAEAVASEAMVNQAAEILVCAPAEDDACARETLAALARRVYRRPPTAAELDDLMVLVEVARAEGDGFEAGIALALQAMLVAPQFLYRSVPADAMDRLAIGERIALDDHELASRLSYFLWGSTPDDALLDRADEGVLQDPEALRAEFDRMLADPKAGALYDGFLRQWLQLGKLGAATPDPAVFPQFDEALRAQMLEETRLFFEDLRARDGSVLELVEGTRTFANAELAAIYGVDGVQGATLVPIETDPEERAGVLTMPAILTMTSGPQAPNIVKRGVWLAETLLCVTPPPPPDGVPPAPDPTPGESERERLERHRADPSCASCHALIDPLGFGFERYDALGSWRTELDGEVIDAEGQLPDGRTFDGLVELAGLLASGPEYPTCVATKLMTYAIGRATTAEENCVMTDIGTVNVAADATLSDLLWAVVTSDAFQSEEVPQ